MQQWGSPGRKPNPNPNPNPPPHQVFVRPVETPAGASATQHNAGVLVHRGGGDVTAKQRSAAADRGGVPPAQHRRFAITVPEGGAVLDILVENMGRVTMGPNEHLQEHKGLLGNVTLGGKPLEGCVSDWSPLEPLAPFAGELGTTFQWIFR